MAQIQSDARSVSRFGLSPRLVDGSDAPSRGFGAVAVGKPSTWRVGEFFQEGRRGVPCRLIGLGVRRPRINSTRKNKP